MIPVPAWLVLLLCVSAPLAFALGVATAAWIGYEIANAVEGPEDN